MKKELNGAAVAEHLAVSFWVDTTGRPLPEFVIKLEYRGQAIEVPFQPAEASKFVNGARDAYLNYMATLNRAFPGVITKDGPQS